MCESPDDTRPEYDFDYDIGNFRYLRLKSYPQGYGYRAKINIVSSFSIKKKGFLLF